MALNICLASELPDVLIYQIQFKEINSDHALHLLSFQTGFLVIAIYMQCTGNQYFSLKNLQQFISLLLIILIQLINFLNKGCLYLRLFIVL